MYACSPSWKSDWMPQDEIRQCLEILQDKIIPAPHGARNISLNHGIHFTGGEPFLNYDLLLYAVEIASRLKIPSTFVETNCSWCISDEVTLNKLQLLKTRGLCGILISVNPYYAEHIPFEFTERCIRISSEIFNSNMFIYQIEFYHLFKEMNIKGTISFKETLELQQLGYNVELFLSGKAVQSLRKYYPAFPADYYFSEPCHPNFLRSWHNHFDNYGNYMPGYCGGISLGNWHELDMMINKGIDLERTPVLKFLITQDFEGLYEYSKKLGFEDKGSGYISKCDLCLQLRSYLIPVKEFSELKPRQFYDQLISESGSGD
jgi:hypothetical protein